MLRTAFACLALFALVPAQAAEGTRPACMPLAKVKAANPGDRFTALTPGQFHFLEGVYVGSPATPEGLPPGDGALLISHEGARDGVIVWTRGALACAPLPVPEKLLKLMGAIKTGALDADGEEL